MVSARTRRRPAEVRALVLEAAEKLFARQGNAETTTDENAAEAGVTRSVMYRHFPTKADLFRASVLTPFIEFLRDYRSVWSSHLDDRWPGDRVMRTMVSLLYDSLHSHRDAVVGLVSAQSSIQQVLSDEVDRLFDEFWSCAASSSLA
jgi:AcrR family transcriptional regulator